MSLEPVVHHAPIGTEKVSRRKPRKLTRPKILSAEAKSAQHHNDTKSRLLTLPPELRNKIYGLVLGGKTIHIYDTKEGGFRSTYCCSKIDDEQYGKHAGAFPDRTEDLYQMIHSKKCCIDLKDFCRRSPDSRISLGFLATCSNVYNEAALIPFADNTFSFNCDRDLSTFVASLILAQHQTIRAICLPDAGNHNFVKDDVWSKLTSLRRLNIVIQIRSRGRSPALD